MFDCFKKSMFVGVGGENSVFSIFDSDPVIFTITAHTKSVAHCLASVLQPSMTVSLLLRYGENLQCVACEN